MTMLPVAPLCSSLPALGNSARRLTVPVAGSITPLTLSTRPESGYSEPSLRIRRTGGNFFSASAVEPYSRPSAKSSFSLMEK